MKARTQNTEVDKFLAELDHPLIELIHALRTILKQSSFKLEENVKWNAPNYSLNGMDCITMKLFPPKQVQLVFHRGTQKQKAPENNLVPDETGLLKFITTDRAVTGFKSLPELQKREADLIKTIKAWLSALKVPA